MGRRPGRRKYEFGNDERDEQPARGQGADAHADADLPQVDLHGVTPSGALRRLSHALHAARQRRVSVLLVITGRGFGNRTGQPVLLPKVEAWLAGPEGLRHGVLRCARDSHGGALRVWLK